VSLLRHRRNWVVAALFILVITGGICWQSILTSLGSFLVDSEPPQRADLVLVLGGDFWGPRVLTGAELARLGYAPLALFSGPPYHERPQGELSIEFLVQKGYPARLFQSFFTNATSTITEAKDLRVELVRRKAKRVILVTASYHSRRAKMVLTLFCPGVTFISVPAPDPHYHVPEWWNDNSSRRFALLEWSKMLGTVLVSYPTYVVARLFGRGLLAQPNK
jgi:uncharacterized SAM-binding protein YcdF (DUF218 family)